MRRIISVVTPSYNQAQFIGETIESVLIQTGEFYMDYVIMDGLSTDRSVEIIKNYEDDLRTNCHIETIDNLNFYIKNNRDYHLNNCSGISYRWFSGKDKGQVDALKKGFALATGEILYWLNSDDILIGSDAFRKIFSHFKENPEVSLIIADSIYIDREGNRTGTWHVDKINFKELIFLDYHISQPSAFFKKDVYESSYLNDKLICAFDADFFIHLLHDGLNYLKTDDILSAFRYYPEIKTLNLSKIRYRESLAISRKYSGNFLFFCISAVFRYFSIVLKPRYENRRTFQKIFRLVYGFSYKIITGKSGR